MELEEPGLAIKVIVLAPCPFNCPNPKKLEPYIDETELCDGMKPNKLFLVRCGHCDSSGPVSSTALKATDAWNKRI